MKIIITESQYNFIKRRYSFVREILDLELKDQSPCRYKHNGYGFNGYETKVLEGVTDFVMEEYPNFYDVGEDEYDEMWYVMYNDLDKLFAEEIKDYYLNADCSEYKKNMNKNEDNNY